VNASPTPADAAVRAVVFNQGSRRGPPRRRPGAGLEVPAVGNGGPGGCTHSFPSRTMGGDTPSGGREGPAWSPSRRHSRTGASAPHFVCWLHRNRLIGRGPRTQLETPMLLGDVDALGAVLRLPDAADDGAALHHSFALQLADPVLLQPVALGGVGQGSGPRRWSGSPAPPRGSAPAPRPSWGWLPGGLWRG
jgi:hypothetical protein